MADKESYVTKLLTLLVSRSDNKTIRISAAELFTQDIGQGITVYWDESTKELVLTYLPAGAKSYIIKENLTWLSQSPLPQSSLESQPRPLSREEMIGKVWTDSQATPTNEELRRPPKQPKVIHLTDEDLALSELESRKRQALKEIQEYESPRPVITPSSNRTTFYKQ